MLASQFQLVDGVTENWVPDNATRPVQQASLQISVIWITLQIEGLELVKVEKMTFQFGHVLVVFGGGTSTTLELPNPSLH